MSELAIQAGERLYTAEEVALCLHVSSKSIQRWCREERLGYYRLGYKILRFSEAHIEQFLRTQEKTGKEPTNGHEA
jgi:excisionase family DNA binding protein